MAHAVEERYITEWESQVALGHQPRLLAFNKFGQNPVINTTPEELWPLGGEHTWLSTGTTLKISCSDNVNGQGQIMRVSGTNGSWNLASVDVALTGTTPVQIGDALDWTVIHTVHQVSAAPGPVGDVYVSVDGAVMTTPGVPDDVADVQAYVDPAVGSAQQIWGMVPADYSVLLYDYACEIETSGGTARTAEVTLEVSPLAKGATVENPSWAPWHALHDITLATQASVHDGATFRFPFHYEEMTRVRLTAYATSNSIVGGHLTALLVPHG